MIGYALANAKRSWYVPNLQVYGTKGWGEFEYLIAEDINSVVSVLFDKISLGDNSQHIMFADLVDIKGNSLPSSLVNPKVIVKQKSDNTAFIVGDESSTGFKIVRTSASSQVVQVDLYIIEMGD